MITVLHVLIGLFNVLANMFKWGFLVVSALILYRAGFNDGLSDWLLLLTILFALLVTICEIFVIIRLRLPNLYINYAKHRFRNSDNE